MTTRHARRSPLLRRMLESIGLALAGRAGARLAGGLGLLTSRSSLLGLVRALPDPQIGTATVLGVDDFALRRGHVYGTDNQRDVNTAHARQRGPGERANAQLKNWTSLRKIHCCAHRATNLVKAILVLIHAR